MTVTNFTRRRGGLLIEALLGLALASLLFQIIAVSGISAYRASKTREQRAKANDLCSASVQVVRDAPAEWAPARTERATSAVGEIEYTITTTTKTASEHLLRAEVIVRWKYGKVERTASRHVSILVGGDS